MVPVLLMNIPPHQPEKLSQLQTILEAGRADPPPVSDRLELRRLADALCHASKVLNRPAISKNRVDAAVRHLSDSRQTLSTGPMQGMS